MKLYNAGEIALVVFVSYVSSHLLGIENLPLTYFGYIMFLSFLYFGGKFVGRKELVRELSE